MKRHLKPEPDPTPERVGMLLALNRVKPQGAIYEGTVPAAVVARRRAANKAARKARRATR